MLDDNPRRIDFMSFASGERHVAAVDGPSDYTVYDEATRIYVHASGYPDEYDFDDLGVAELRAGSSPQLTRHPVLVAAHSFRPA